MKTLIIYYSEYRQNTEKLARTFAKKIDAKLISINEVHSVDLANYDLIGFGSGVYRESLSPKLFQLVETLNLEARNTFVFSTNGVGMNYYNKPLIKKLLSKGAINRGSFACKGAFDATDFTRIRLFQLLGKLSQGHPSKKDLVKAEIFIVKLMTTLEEK
jgi:flavodoxin